MAKLPWVFGGGALVAYVLSRGKRPNEPSIATSVPPSAWDEVPRTTSPFKGRWIYPVPSWIGRKPSVSSGIGSPRPGGPHRGVDIMFLRKSGDPFHAGTPNGSKLHVMPDNHLVVAAADGVVWSAAPTPHGHAVVIDHGPLKVATFYQHMEKLFVSETDGARSQQRVKAGEPIGIVGFSPLDGERLKHLHFEVWLGGPKDWIDPEPLLETWQVIDDPRTASLVAMRNAGFVYRPVGSRGDAYPDWVRALDGKSGVYVIRERRPDGSTEIVYVGESHTGRLYDTLTRHFQTWRRWKGFWKGQYGEGHDPGLTYRRDRIEVAVRTTSAAEALDEELRLIRRLKPRDNLLGQAVEEVVPF